MAKIRVRIVQTVEVDTDDWSLEYGTENKARAVVADVKNYFENIISESSDLVELAE